MIEKLLEAKQPTEDDMSNQTITNSSPSGDFMELFSSVYASQQIDSIPSSSTTPQITPMLHDDSTIREVEIEPGKTLKISSILSKQQT